MYDLLLITVIVVSLRFWRLLGLGVVLAPLMRGKINVFSIVYSVILLLIPPLVSIYSLMLLCYSPDGDANINDYPILVRAKIKTILPIKNNLRSFSTCFLPVKFKDPKFKVCKSYSFITVKLRDRLLTLTNRSKKQSPKLKKWLDSEMSKMYKDLYSED